MVIHLSVENVYPVGVATIMILKTINMDVDPVQHLAIRIIGKNIYLVEDRQKGCAVLVSTGTVLIVRINKSFIAYA